MKKSLLSLSLLLMAAAASFTFVSCSDDDEPSPQTDGNTPSQVEAVDLGLPSGTLWATCNVGATAPDQPGDYFAWGEVQGAKSGKTEYNWLSYKWCEGDENKLTKYCTNSSNGYSSFTDQLTELLPADDAASANWSSQWCTPTANQWKEIVFDDYTTKEIVTQNGMKGCKITSKKNGNSIFLPAAGCWEESSLSGAGQFGAYWARTISVYSPDEASGAFINSNGMAMELSDRFCGYSIRPVRASE